METNLLSEEKLDRSSPDLWPEQIPGMGNFAPFVSPQQSPTKTKFSEMNESDFALLFQLGNLSPLEIIEEVKKLQTVAYQLGVEEAKEMTRGKYLHVLNQIKEEH
ncbi:ATP-binding cassette sub-family A member 3 [Armadillidium nasatum]|uniref:ATP-binding cassette sub-family A member 3 n=2 Tax=Armadillidium nasatum TaxID=96803 RepID=A0A5N5T8P1_9CRUS|nr:ATP-binding cassette sub-family A member 3 [Armadillidium nasatum]